MTASFDNGPEPDDRPYPPSTARVPYRPEPSRTGRVFRWWLALSVLALFACALCVLLGFAHAGFAPLHIVVDGDDLTDGITINGLSDGGRALLGVGALMFALLLLLLIPVLIFLVVGSVLIALVCGIGVPLVVLALALAVATSPLWMVGLLIWLVARRRPSPALARSATMAA
jgi:hypothetical protein